MIRTLPKKLKVSLGAENSVLVLVAFLLGASLLMLTGCGKKESPVARPISLEVATPDPRTVGSIRGRVQFDGAIPAPKMIDMSADPGCRGPNAAETFAGENGGLANVFVYIEGDDLNRFSHGSGQKPVVVSQDGCRYHPHVAGVMVGQTIDFFNADPTTHNIHASAQRNREWNESQPPNAPVLERVFDNPEIMLPVKCNQHPWMRMYINVVSHPFFAVSANDGRYEISGVPPGNYTLAFVHEKSGEQDIAISLSPREHKTVNATFKQP